MVNNYTDHCRHLHSYVYCPTLLSAGTWTHMSIAPCGLSRNLDSHVHHAHLPSTSNCIHIPTSILSCRNLHSHGPTLSFTETYRHMHTAPLWSQQASILTWPLLLSGICRALPSYGQDKHQHSHIHCPLTSACVHTHTLTAFPNLCRFLHSKAN